MDIIIKLSEIVLYEAVSITNDRGGTAHIGYRYTKAAAELLAKGKGWYAGDGEVYERNLYTDGEYLYELKKGRPHPVRNDMIEKEEVLASIREKLSETELEALGLI